MKLCYIHAYRHRFGVEPICAVLSAQDMKIAPQTYYRWLACPVRPAELEEAYLVNAVVDLYRQNRCVYGVTDTGGVVDLIAHERELTALPDSNSGRLAGVKVMPTRTAR